MGEKEVPGVYKENETLYEKWYQHLPSQLSLPDSDLLHAIHAYVSDFYSAVPNGECAMKSMDGTALLAMGILLEEMAAEVMGDTGYLAFLESKSMSSGRMKTFWNGVRETPFYYKGNQPRRMRENDKTTGNSNSEHEVNLDSNTVVISESEESEN